MKSFTLLATLLAACFMTGCASPDVFDAGLVRGLSFETSPLVSDSIWKAEIPGSEIRPVLKHLEKDRSGEVVFALGTQRGTLHLQGGAKEDIYWSRIKKHDPEFVFSIEGRRYILRGVSAREFVRIVGDRIQLQQQPSGAGNE